MLLGYGRVSTQDQNLDLQIEALAQAGCKRVFEDRISGSRAERPGFAKALEMAQAGDTLVVWKLDRLGRVKHPVRLGWRAAPVRCAIQEPHGCHRHGHPLGPLLLSSHGQPDANGAGAVRAGLEVARQLGRKGGRKRQMTDSKIEWAKKLLTNGVPPKDVAKNLGVSVPTLYRWIPAPASHP